MTPVLLLSDGYLANGAEPWLIPQMSTLAPIAKSFHKPQLNEAGEPIPFLPYERDENLGRPWAIPGTAGLEHRLGGLEKEHRTRVTSPTIPIIISLWSS